MARLLGTPSNFLLSKFGKTFNKRHKQRRPQVGTWNGQILQIHDRDKIVLRDPRSSAAPQNQEQFRFMVESHTASEHDPCAPLCLTGLPAR